MITTGVIGVGGLGERLGIIDKQKCLVPLDEKPILQYVIDGFIYAGIKSIIFLTCHFSQQVYDFIKLIREDYDCEFIIAQDAGEGEANAIAGLKYLLKEPFLYAGGDVVFVPETVIQLIDDSSHFNNIAGISINSNLEAAPHMRIIVDKNQFVLRLEKPEQQLEKLTKEKFVNMGIYFFRPDIMAYLARAGAYSPMEKFVDLVKVDKHKVFVSITRSPWFSLHQKEDLEKWKSSEIRELLKAKK